MGVRGWEWRGSRKVAPVPVGGTGATQRWWRICPQGAKLQPPDRAHGQPLSQTDNNQPQKDGNSVTAGQTGPCSLFTGGLHFPSQHPASKAKMGLITAGERGEREGKLRSREVK